MHELPWSVFSYYLCYFYDGCTLCTVLRLFVCVFVAKIIITVVVVVVAVAVVVERMFINVT